MVNLLRGTRFAHISSQDLKRIDNRANGDCLYECVLDSARAWLPPHHDLNRLFRDRWGGVDRKVTREKNAAGELGEK